jgi:hypothetical protein
MKKPNSQKFWGSVSLRRTVEKPGQSTSKKLKENTQGIRGRLFIKKLGVRFALCKPSSNEFVSLNNDCIKRIKTVKPIN